MKAPMIHSISMVPKKERKKSREISESNAPRKVWKRLNTLIPLLIAQKMLPQQYNIPL